MLNYSENNDICVRGLFSPHTVVQGEHPQNWVEWGGVALLRKPAITLKRGKIAILHCYPRLLLMTSRKSRTRFRLVPESTTLDDLEEPLRTLFQSRSRGYNYSLPHIEFSLYKNSFVNRCLFNMI